MSDAQEISVVLAGLGGYGAFYIEHLLKIPVDDNVRLLLVAEPHPESDRCKDLAYLNDRSIPVVANMDLALQQGVPDLVALSVPIHRHASMTVSALSKGANVLCEKPLCASMDEARSMLQHEQDAPGFVAIGYQWSFAPPIQALKADIQAGKFGRPIRLRTLAADPRDVSYYARNNWAGAVRAPDGSLVNDSPANNATAHYLHNMFFLLGDRCNTSAMPRQVTAELYRVNAIENFDTCAIRSLTDDGVEVLFYSSHAIPKSMGVIMRIECENGVIEYNGINSGGLVARLADGTVINYGEPHEDFGAKIRNCIQSIRDGSHPLCGIAAASAQTACIESAQHSMPQICEIPDSVRRFSGEGEKRIYWGEGITEMLQNSFDAAVLPSELATSPSWICAGKTIDLDPFCG